MCFIESESFIECNKHVVRAFSPCQDELRNRGSCHTCLPRDIGPFPNRQCPHCQKELADAKVVEAERNQKILEDRQKADEAFERRTKRIQTQLVKDRNRALQGGSVFRQIASRLTDGTTRIATTMTGTVTRSLSSSSNRTRRPPTSTSSRSESLSASHRYPSKPGRRPESRTSGSPVSYPAPGNLYRPGTNGSQYSNNTGLVRMPRTTRTGLDGPNRPSSRAGVSATTNFIPGMTTNALPSHPSFPSPASDASEGPPPTPPPKDEETSLAQL